MMDILDRLNRHIAAVGFIADSVQDPQASAALATIEDDMTMTTDMIRKKKKKKENQ